MSNDPLKIPSKGPHSRAFKRGAADGWDARSRDGKLLRRAEAELTAQIGGEPTWAQAMLITRCARTYLQLDLLDRKFASGVWTVVDSNIQRGLAGSLRLTLRDLGLKAQPAPKMDLPTYLASKAK